MLTIIVDRAPSDKAIYRPRLEVCHGIISMHQNCKFSRTVLFEIIPFPMYTNPSATYTSTVARPHSFTLFLYACPHSKVIFVERIQTLWKDRRIQCESTACFSPNLLYLLSFVDLFHPRKSHPSSNLPI